MNIEFTSQICTTREQSERLLTLGLSTETADMCWFNDMQKPFCAPYKCFAEKAQDMKWVILPAWSLHRLVEMMPSFIDIGEHNYMFSIIQGKLFSYTSDIVGNGFLYGKGSVYDSAIYTIEWLIKEGYFNKDYLK